MTRHVVFLLASLVGAAPALAGTCPALDAATSACQTAVAKAGAGYAKSHLKAAQKCLLGIQTGAVSGDPATACLGAPPTDALTADALAKASAKVTKLLAAKCTDAAAAALQGCSPTAAGLAACLVADHQARLNAALSAEFGAVAPSPDPLLQKCQKAVAKEAAKYLNLRLKTVQKCMASRQKTCGAPGALDRCLAPQDSGPANESKAALALDKAETKLREKLAKACTDTQVAALDGCDDDVNDLGECLVCTHANAADLALGGQYRAVRIATAGSTSIQAAANAAEAGDTVLVEAGTYTEAVQLKDTGLTVRGLKDCGTGARPLVLPPSPSTPDGIYHCGSRLPGCADVADDVLLESLEVNDFNDNDVYSVGIVGITYRDMVTRGPGLANVTRYGLFPIMSDGVLIENSLATGISDAGLYVGQSTNIVMRENEVHSSVAGLEVENSSNAEVYDNYLHDNAGGLLVFKLAGLPVQDSDCHVIRDNVVQNNNGPNYGAGIVGLVPSGTGMLIISADTTVISGNTITGNDSFGLGVVDQASLNFAFEPDPFPTTSPDQDVNGNAFVGNVITGNGLFPDPSIVGLNADVSYAPFFQSGNCQSGNTFGTTANPLFTGLAACANPLPDPLVGCPYVQPTTTTTTTTSTSSSTTSTLPWTFAAQVQPLLSTRCAGCHGGIGTPQYAGLIDLDVPASAYANIVNVPSAELATMDRIEPGDHMLSYIWHKVNGTHLTVGGTGDRMPQFGPYLTQSDLDGIAGWIDAGAPND